MPVDRPGITATQLAKNYVASLNEFAHEVMALLMAPTGQPVARMLPAKRREVCAAVSAAMISALDASSLSAAEREALDPALHEMLVPFWDKFAARDPGASAYILERSAHYLQSRTRGSQVKTAVQIVVALLAAIGVEKQEVGEMTRKLTPAFAHRMVSDLYRINDATTRIGIEFSLIAALAALLGMSASCESIVRLLRGFS